MDSYFVGSKSSLKFLFELRKKKDLTIYKPDKISKDEEFYEKYALGKVVFTAKNAEIIGGKRASPLTPPCSFRKLPILENFWEIELDK